MSTAMTATLPNLEYSSDPASGSLHGLPTMPFAALAWSLAESGDAEEPLAPNLIPAAPLASTRSPKSTRGALVAVVFGGVTGRGERARRRPAEGRRAAAAGCRAAHRRGPEADAAPAALGLAAPHLAAPRPAGRSRPKALSARLSA